MHVFALALVAMQYGKKEARPYEIIPGALVWVSFIIAIVLSIWKPLWAIYVIIIFDLYWLFRVVYFVIFVTYSWNRYRRSIRISWFEKLKKEKSGWEDIVHLIFLPMAGEPLEIVDEAFRALCAAHYPKEKFIVVLAGEGREEARFRTVADEIVKRYGDAFYRLLVTVHPADVPGEIISKGANVHYAAREAKRAIDELSLAYERVVVSTFDIDTIVHPEYFSCLTYTYVSQPDPTRASYQPIVLYNNNMWDSPAPMRLAALSTTYWILTELARPDRLFTFSSHSMSFRALVDVGFWENDMINEDSRIYLQCYMHYNGKYAVVPLYIPVSMDTVAGTSLFESLINLYKQQRRWAWGVEHFPYLALQFARRPQIPLHSKIYRLWLQLEGMYTWATAPIIILILGWMPLFFADSAVKTTVLAQNAPHILAWLMNFSMVGILVLGLLSFSLLPPRPERHDPYNLFFMVAQWALLPITIILFSALPAIDAQTRFMLGKYLGSFNVTRKMR